MVTSWEKQFLWNMFSSNKPAINVYSYRELFYLCESFFFFVVIMGTNKEKEQKIKKKKDITKAVYSAPVALTFVK